ncbi:MAG TPA: GNAT family N-acetyltransferase [Actinomycetota bacterium]|jgi:predicted N-acetyltransferase YhbS|nr:GNAT family N-acetyltransferase [Actinomycetota bacterium]
MKRTLEGGFEIDDDRSRVDVDAVHRFLTEEAYWVAGRSRETIERLVRESTRVIGAYAADGALVGFARVVTDGSNFAWLGDVFVLVEHRGRGLGVELVREAVEHEPERHCTWYLNTRDAHGLYARFGFRPANDAPARLGTERARVATGRFPERAR